MAERNYNDCFKHDGVCKSIEYLEKAIEENKLDIRDKTNQIKDARSSLKHDFERFEDFMKQEFVTKAELDPIKKLVYGVAALMVAEVARRIFL